MDEERLANEHRAGDNRFFFPEPRVVRDRAIVAQYEILVIAEVYGRSQTMPLARGIGQRPGIVQVAIDPQLADGQVAAIHTQSNRTLPGGWDCPTFLIVERVEQKPAVHGHEHPAVECRCLQSERSGLGPVLTKGIPAIRQGDVSAVVVQLDLASQPNRDPHDELVGPGAERHRKRVRPSHQR